MCDNFGLSSIRGFVQHIIFLFGYITWQEIEKYKLLDPVMHIRPEAPETADAMSASAASWRYLYDSFGEHIDAAISVDSWLNSGELEWVREAVDLDLTAGVSDIKLQRETGSAALFCGGGAAEDVEELEENCARLRVKVSKMQHYRCQLSQAGGRAPQQQSADTSWAGTAAAVGRHHTGWHRSSSRQSAPPATTAVPAHVLHDTKLDLPSSDEQSMLFTGQQLLPRGTIIFLLELRALDAIIWHATSHSNVLPWVRAAVIVRAQCQRLGRARLAAAHVASLPLISEHVPRARTAAEGSPCIGNVASLVDTGCALLRTERRGRGARAAIYSSTLRGLFLAPGTVGLGAPGVGSGRILLFARHLFPLRLRLLLSLAAYAALHTARIDPPPGREFEIEGELVLVLGDNLGLPLASELLPMLCNRLLRGDTVASHLHQVTRRDATGSEQPLGAHGRVLVVIGATVRIVCGRAAAAPRLSSAISPAVPRARRRPRRPIRFSLFPRALPPAGHGLVCVEPLMGQRVRPCSVLCFYCCRY